MWGCGGGGGVFHRNISTTKSFNDCFRLFARVLSSGMWLQEGGTDGGGGKVKGGRGGGGRICALPLAIPPSG